MIRKLLAIVLGIVILALIAGYGVRRVAARPASPLDPQSFAARVDLTPLSRLAVNYGGRLKSFESHAAAMMQVVSGPNRIQGQSPSFTYLDLMLRDDAYEDVDVVFVKNKLVRGRMAELLERSLHDQIAALRPAEGSDAAAGFAERERDIVDHFNTRMAAFQRTGLISPLMLDDPDTRLLRVELERDVMRTKKDADAISSALTVKSSQFLSDALRLLPPPGDNEATPWKNVDEIRALAAAPADADSPSPLERELAADWMAFEQAWKDQNPQEAGSALARFVARVPELNASLYPQQSRLWWEGWYITRAHSLTWVWILYGLAFVPLLLSVVYRWPAARWIGLGMFLLAFGFHTFALGLRWHVAGRWPNSNMFEALTTAAWFGGAAALFLEFIVRRTPMRNFFALSSAAASACAFMAVHFLPLQLNANISNMMPVLHDVWLYIHTNVIIFSYALIFLASIPAMGYLIYRLGGGKAEYAVVGGAGTLIMTAPDGGSYLTRAKTSVGEVLDGTTMVLMELAFILLWTGLVMGAIWADHSWGRPWGWDPKEVFALNTFIIFALLVHVRFKVKDKGLWTALLAVVGCVVMLFNWIIINFTISGLHSYA